MNWKASTALVPFALSIGLAAPAEARVTSINITSSVPAYGGASFGSVGQYTMVTGIANGEVDPKDPLNAIIQDIALAPRNAKGMVEYSTNFQVLMPSDPTKSNKTMWFDISNRGNILSLRFFHIGTSANLPQGDGFLEKQGLIMVWAGWQADLLPAPHTHKDRPVDRLTMVKVPDATENGQPITGPVRAEWTILRPTSTLGITESRYNNDTRGYPTVTLDNKGLNLTARRTQEGPKETIPNSDWAFADCTDTPFPGKPNAYKVCMKNGFDTDHIYELVYTGKDPTVMGLGFAAIRDVGSFFRFADKDDKGVANPLKGQIKYAHVTGQSQTGRTLLNFLQLGFNQDEQKRQVYDGAMPMLAVVGDYINIRFSQPGRSSPDQSAEKQFPASEMPTTYGDLDDDFGGIKGGLLSRCRTSNTCPKIFHAITDAEYWQFTGRSSTTDALGTRDVDIPDNVRVYHMAGAQHGGFDPASPVPTSTGICEQLPNLNSYTYSARAMMVNLQQWVAAGTPPPNSTYARISDGTLVALEKLNFPKLPGVTGPEGKAGSETGVYNTRVVYNRGPRFNTQDLSGIVDIEPPMLIKQYPPFVPKVNADGNPIDGVQTAILKAPFGTYTGWNVRSPGNRAGDACTTTGSFVPFPVLAAERKASSDPRLSLEERYTNTAGYTKAVSAGVNELVKNRWMLPSDAEHAIKTATGWFTTTAKGKLQ